MDRISIYSSLHVAIDAVAHLLGVDGAIHEEALLRAQQLQVGKEERFVSAVVVSLAAFTKTRQENWPTERTAEDVLHKLRTTRAIDGVVVFVRVETRRLVELEKRTVKVVCTRLRYESHLRTAAASEVGGEVAR